MPWGACRSEVASGIPARSALPDLLPFGAAEAASSCSLVAPPPGCERGRLRLEKRPRGSTPPPTLLSSLG